MATHVYANGNEIASKSADGSSKHAFPDICHTPPATASPTPIKPFPPGVPIPYPNSCHASDITNGSRTVFILGKEIALENHSYFSVSEGDDAATRKLAKGIISGAVKGRCFFQTWSPNVKVEGRAVTRHLDLVSHNHKNPSNTALFPYVSRGWRGHACKKEEDRINKACDDPDPNDPNRSRTPRKRNVPLRGRASTTANSPSAGGQHWTDKHCSGLLRIKNNTGADKIQDALQSMDEEIASLHQYLTDYDNLAKLIQQEVEDWAVRQGVKLGVKAGARQLAGSFVPLAGNVAMGLWSAYDAASFAGELASKREEIMALIDEVKNLDDQIKKATDLKDRLENIRNGTPGIGPDGSPDSPNKVLGDMQEALALTNACLRARKCSLVPYRSADHIAKQESSGRASEVETARTGGGGCCPGQTGHHLIPGTVMRPKVKRSGVWVPDGRGCDNYNHATAPTVCVESALKDAGSHKRAHDAYDAAQQERVDASRNFSSWNPFASPPVEDGSMSMEETIDTAVDSFQEAFPLSGCSRRCIEAQLKDYYNKHCRKARPRIADQNGGDIETRDGD